MICTTLNGIKAHSHCDISRVFEKLLSSLNKTSADDEPISLLKILKLNGLRAALWCLRSVPEESARWRRLSVSFARFSEHLMKDARSVAALDVAERYSYGLASDIDLAEASASARDAAITALKAEANADHAFAKAAWQAARAAEAAEWACADWEGAALGSASASEAAIWSFAGSDGDEALASLRAEFKKLFIEAIEALGEQS